MFTNVSTYSELPCSSGNARLNEIAPSVDVRERFLRSTEDVSLQALYYNKDARRALGRILADTLDPWSLSTIEWCFSDRSRGALQVKLPADALRLSERVTHHQVACWNAAIVGLLGELHMRELGRFYKMIESTHHAQLYGVPMPETQRPVGLHTDGPLGAFGERPVDLVAIGLITARNVRKGRSVLLHMDDFPDIKTFLDEPILKQGHNALFGRNLQGLSMRFSGRVLPPAGPRECACHASVLAAVRLVHECDAVTRLSLDPGDVIVINNNVWLHGREGLGDDRQVFRQVAVTWGYVPAWHEAIAA